MIIPGLMKGGRTGALALLVGLAGCQSDTSFFLIASGGSFSANGWSVCGARISVREGTPGVIFGTRKPDGGDCRLSYVIVFRHAARDASEIRRRKSSVRFDGTHSVIEDGVGMGDSSIALTLRSKLEKGKTSPTTESITVGDKPRDPSAGRVFLVDLRVNPPIVEQIKASLPSKVSEPLKLEVVPRLAEEILDSLGASDEFREFRAR